MRVRSFFALGAVAATAVAAVAGVPSASAATTVSLTVADMYTFDADSPFVKVVCIDDVPMASEAGDVHAPISLASGDHHLEVFTGTDDDCNQGGANIDETITLSEAPNQTLLLSWPSDTGPQASVLVDDTSCPDPGTAHVTYRPGAAVPGDGNTDLGHSDFVPFVHDVAVGHQGTAVVTPGTYANWNAVLTTGGTMVVDGPDSSTLSSGGVVYVYTLGGNDGDTGMIIAPEILCIVDFPGPPPVTPPVVVTPAFTG